MDNPFTDLLEVLDTYKAGIKLSTTYKDCETIAKNSSCGDSVSLSIKENTLYIK